LFFLLLLLLLLLLLQLISLFRDQQDSAASHQIGYASHDYGAL
jgi:hypothetical protein